MLGLPPSVVDDSSYKTEEALAYLQSQGIKTVIPLMGGRNRPKHFKKELFLTIKKMTAIFVQGRKC